MGVIHSLKEIEPPPKKKETPGESRSQSLKSERRDPFPRAGPKRKKPYLSEFVVYYVFT